MKKLLLSFTMMSAMLLQAQTQFTVDNLIYEVLDSNSVALVSDKEYQSSYTGDVVVPANVENNGTKYTVTTIGKYAFYASTVTSIQLPNTITTLYDRSFNYARSLTTINIPASVKNYCNSSFPNEDIINPMFKSCGKLKNVTLEEGLTVLARCMFEDCMEEGSVINVPGSVKELPHAVFSSAKIEKLTLNEGLEKICDYALSGIKVNSITLPSTVKEIEGEAFRNSELSEINLNEGLTTIQKAAFSKCKNLKTIVLPSTINFIGYYAFRESEALTDIYVKATTVPGIENREYQGNVITAFSNMAAGIKVHVPVGCLAKYKADTFWGALNLDEAEAPSALESIEVMSGDTDVYDLMGRPQQQLNKGMNVTTNGLIWVK